MSTSDSLATVTLGDVTYESTERLGSPTAECPVYGVDRTVGLTPAAKYVAVDLSRYKRLSPGMFAYNPMRLNIGSIGYCSNKHRSGVVSPDYVVFRCDTARVDPEFLSYYILSPRWRDWTQGSGVGSVRMRIYFRELARMAISLPPLIEQHAIADILRTLDDKIDLNRRMNKTLEAVARALFKSWFVDFHPVRIKAEGLDSGLPSHLDDLFPDSFEGSKLAEIPKGWAIGTLTDNFTVTMGQSPPGDTYNDEGVGLPFYQGRVDFGFRFPSRRVYCSAPTRIAEAGDALVTVRAPVGDVNMATERCCIGRGVAAVRHKSNARSFTYYSMQALREDFNQFEGEGTVFGSIGKKDFHAIATVLPTSEVVAAFERLASPLDDRIEINERESQTLSALRDVLLPKLISGEIRVTDAERFVESGV